MSTGHAAASPSSHVVSAFASSPSPAAPQTARRGRFRRWFGSNPRAERRTAYAIAGLVITVWLVVIFGRAIADSNTLAQRQAQEEAINAQLRAQVAAGHAEIDFIQTEPFLRFEARTYGMGSAEERAFALDSNAPSPRPITPLGADHPETDTSTSIEDWLHLLFGN